MRRFYYRVLGLALLITGLLLSYGGAPSITGAAIGPGTSTVSPVFFVGILLILLSMYFVVNTAGSDIGGLEKIMKRTGTGINHLSDRHHRRAMLPEVKNAILEYARNKVMGGKGRRILRRMRDKNDVEGMLLDVAAAEYIEKT